MYSKRANTKVPKKIVTHDPTRTSTRAQRFALILPIPMTMNLGLALFNPLPIPPLDGGQILVSLVPNRLQPALHHLMPFGVIALIALVMTARPADRRMIGNR